MTHPHRLIIDTDPGVDDALALAWLLSQTHYPLEILGIGVTAGNTTAVQAAHNTLTLLHTLHRADIPVAIGASSPRQYPLSQSSLLIHGPDGLWGASRPHALDGCATDAAAFYRDLASANPGATLLTLGPLTNVATAVQQYPAAMQTLGRLVVLGGAKTKGSMTPVSEYNFWQDPHAAEIVLAAGLPITLIIRDAFTAFTVSDADLERMMARETAVCHLLRQPLKRYTGLYTAVGGHAAATIPDLAAALLAVDPALATSRPALVKVITHDGLARGQTIIGYDLTERVTMIAPDEELGALARRALQDPTFDFAAHLQAILAREPANADVVTAVAADSMRRLFLETIL